MAFPNYSNKTFTPTDFDNAFNFVTSMWHSTGRTGIKSKNADTVYQDFRLESLMYDNNPALLVEMTRPVKGRMCIQTSSNKMAMYFKRIMPGRVYRVSENLQFSDHVTVTRDPSNNEMKAHVTLYPYYADAIPPEISENDAWNKEACQAIFGVPRYPNEFKLYLKLNTDGELTCERIKAYKPRDATHNTHSWVNLKDHKGNVFRDKKGNNPTVHGLCGFSEETGENIFERRLHNMFQVVRSSPNPRRPIDIRRNIGEREWWQNDVKEHFRAFQQDIQERVKVLLEQFWICVKILSKQRNDVGQVASLYSKSEVAANALQSAPSSSRSVVSEAHSKVKVNAQPPPGDAQARRNTQTNLQATRKRARDEEENSARPNTGTSNARPSKSKKLLEFKPANAVKFEK